MLREILPKPLSLNTNVLEILKNPRTGLDCMCKHLLSRGSYQKTVPARVNGDTKGNANSPLPGKVQDQEMD